MAFNPFHGFRKHQKTLLAGITVFCMVIFVLQSGLGRGDFFGLFDRPMQGRGKSEKAAVLYGKTVTAEEVVDLQRQRTLAEQYIRTAIGLGQQEVMRRVNGELMSLLKSDENSQRAVNQIVFARILAFNTGRQSQQWYFQYVQQIPQFVAQLQSLQAGFLSAKRETEAYLVRQLAEVIQQDRQMLSQPPGHLYFGGTTTNLQDLLDFKIWLHQADRLGVNLSNKDIGQMIRQEALGQLTGEGLNSLERMIENTYRNLDKETLAKSVGDEFRVRIAKAAMLGFNTRPDPEESYVVPSPVTPFECWQFFRAARAESEIALLPISVKHKDFLTEAGTPTDEELKTLYETGKLFEPTPGLSRPAFRQPERIEVEWVNARVDSPWYQEQAKRALEVLKATIQATAGFLAPLGGLPAVTDTVTPLVFDLSLIGKYETDAKLRFESASWLDPWRSNLHEQNLNRAENAVSLVGQAMAGTTAGSAALTAPLAYLATGYGFETKDRARIGNELILHGALLTPWSTAGLAFAISPREDFRPLAAVRQHVQERLLDGLARDLIHANLTKLVDELYRLSEGDADRLRKKHNLAQPALIAAAVGEITGAAVGADSWQTAPMVFASQVAARELKEAQQLASLHFLASSARLPFLAAALRHDEESRPQQVAREFLAKAIPEYRLQHGRTSLPRNRFNIGDDPGLAPLKQSFGSLPAPPGPDGRERTFDQLFFPDFYNAYMPKRWPRMESQGGFVDPQQPDAIWNVSAEPFLFWKTGYLSPYIPSFDEAKPQVEDAWRVDKARKLAQAEAEKLAAEAKKAGPDALRVLKDGSKHSGSLINLDHVARYEKPIFAFASREMDGNTYRPYRIPAAKVAFPAVDFLNKLLELKDKGQVAVLSDRPETTYFVATLVERILPDEAAFYTDFSRYHAALVSLIEQDTHYRERYREAVVKRLQDDAGLQIDEAYKKKFDNPRASSPMEEADE